MPGAEFEHPRATDSCSHGIAVLPAITGSPAAKLIWGNWAHGVKYEKFICVVHQSKNKNARAMSEI